MRAFWAALALSSLPVAAHAATGTVTAPERELIGRCEGWWKTLDVNGEATVGSVRCV